MDNLKDMKACLQNDFTRYKRAFGAIRSNITNGQAIFDESHKLQMFLANPVRQQRQTLTKAPPKRKSYISSLSHLSIFILIHPPVSRVSTPQVHPKQLIFFNLRTELKKVENHEEVLIEMLQQCVDFLERGIFVTPDDKYRLLRGLPHLLLLIDGDKDDGTFNVFKSKKVKLDPVKALFKQFPVLPMYGDMPIRPEVILQRAPHYDVASMGASWGGVEDKGVAEKYQIKGHWQPMRKLYDELMAKLAVTVNEVEARQASGAVLEKDMGSVATGQRVASLVVACFDALREWSCRVQEMIAWKMSYPASEEDLAKQKVKLRMESFGGGHPSGLSLSIDCALLVGGPVYVYFYVSSLHYFLIH
jgi:cytoplasmic FMR1 interacting protein